MEKQKPERRRPERPPITHRFRMVLWLAIGIAPVIVYPLLAMVLSSSGYEAKTAYDDSLIGVFVALGIIVLFFNLGLQRRLDMRASDSAFIFSLALAEAIGIEGFVLWLLIKWNWGFWAMMVMQLLSAWPLRPQKDGIGV